MRGRTGQLYVTGAEGEKEGTGQGPVPQGKRGAGPEPGQVTGSGLKAAIIARRRLTTSVAMSRAKRASSKRRGERA